MRWPFGRRERLRQQAADWVAKLNGPHDERDRAAFADWYGASPDHAAAYDRSAALFAMAADLRPIAAAPADPGTSAFRGGRPTRYALAGVAAILALAALAIAGLGGRMPPKVDNAQTATFAANADQPRHITLSDGSRVVLAPDSELEVAIDRAKRQLRLRKGEGRFTVFHDGRPFVVLAQGAEILARGTQFRVRLGDDGTLVELVEGQVEVFYRTSAGRKERRVAVLAPGQRVVVPGGDPAPAAHAGSALIAGMIEFDDVRLAEAVDRINRQAIRRVQLADQALGEKRVTGAFRASDAQGFAEGVAVAFGLEVWSGPDGTLWLGPRAQD